MVLEEDAYRLERLGPGAELVARTLEGFHLPIAWLFQCPTFPGSLQAVTDPLAEK